MRVWLTTKESVSVTLPVEDATWAVGWRAFGVQVPQGSCLTLQRTQAVRDGDA